MSSNIGLIYPLAGALMFTLVADAQVARGTPGVDYPNYHSFPKTSFRCSEQKYIPGFYADLETECQAFHFCLNHRQESFLCPIGTIFNQAILTCDSWYNSNCSVAPLFYSVNEGIAVESDGEETPMLIKLRSLYQSKSPNLMSTVNVYDKIASLYQTSTNDATQSHGARTDSLFKDERVESSPKVNSDLKSDEMSVGSENESQLREEFLSNLEGIQSDAELEEAYYPDLQENEDQEDDGDTSLLYDPVTDGYYVNYDRLPNEWQQDSPIVNSKHNFYDYGNLAEKYEEMLRDERDSLQLQHYIDENVRSSESGIESIMKFSERNDDFSRRLLRTQQLPKRVRRQPIYVADTDDEQVVTPSSRFRDNRYLVLESEESQSSTESNTSDKSEELSTERTSDTSEEITEGPMTSEEFEDAILRELVLPGFAPGELESRPLLASENEQLRNESSTYEIRDFQSDYSMSVENGTPENYESDSPAYGFQDDIVIEEIPDSNVEILRSSEQGSEWYQNEETSEVPVEEADETFIVIPDEFEEGNSDSGSISSDDGTNINVPVDPNTYSEMDAIAANADNMEDEFTFNEEIDGQTYEGSEMDTEYESYDEFRNYYLSNYESPEAYRRMDNFQYRVPEYDSEDEMESEKQFVRGSYYDFLNSELLKSPYDLSDSSSYTADDTATNYQDSSRFDSADDGSSRTYSSEFSVDRSDGSYAHVQQHEQPMHYLNYMYNTQNGYLYENPYANPYPEENSETLGYGILESADSSESEALNEIPAAPFENKYYHPEAKTPFWIQNDPPGSSGTEDEQFESGSRDPAESATNVYGDVTFSSSEDLSREESGTVEGKIIDASLGSKNEEMEETFYVFDFEDGDEQAEALNTDAETSESVTDGEPTGPKESELPGVQEFLRTGERTSQPSESSDVSSNSDVVEMSESSKTVRGDLLQSKKFSSSQTNELKSSDSSVNVALNVKSKELSDPWSSWATESSMLNEMPVTLSSALERLAGLKTAKAPRVSNARNLDFSTDNRFLDSMKFPEAMNFGPYGIDANVGQQYGKVDSSVPDSKVSDSFSLRTGEPEQPKLSKLSALQERIRSMKQGKFGVFKKYMNSVGNRKD